MTIKDIKSTLDAYLEGTKVKEKEIVAALEALGSKYTDDSYPFEIMEIAGGFQFMTKGAFFPLISQFLKIESKKKISRSALETLSVISYKQPVTKSSMESVRGVNCDYAVQKLLEKELIEIIGRAEGPGRPLLYGTTEKFMNHFGLKNLNELPKIKEFEMPDNEVGVQSDDLPAPQLPSEGKLSEEEMASEEAASAEFANDEKPTQEQASESASVDELAEEQPQENNEEPEPLAHEEQEEETPAMTISDEEE